MIRYGKEEIAAIRELLDNIEANIDRAPKGDYPIHFVAVNVEVDPFKYDFIWKERLLFPNEDEAFAFIKFAQTNERILKVKRVHTQKQSCVHDFESAKRWALRTIGEQE